ncbi:hypothetical protein Tco_0916113 [Tanacetum coccineum]
MAKKEVEFGREELVDLLGIYVVTNLYKAKLKYDKYCDKMLNRRALGKITNYDVLLKEKGYITLKVYRDDGSDETIQNFMASDLHLSEWREVMNVCPKRTGARWTTIYSQINQRMINLHKTKAELELDFNKPLGEQDPIIKLNDLARKKKKHADDIHDYFRSTKRYKSSVKYKDHPVGTVLNEPSLGMILFNSHQRQDFVNTKDFEDLSNEILYTVYEIFFRLHQGPGQDDHARTFSSFLLAEVDKRNLNPLKQMRVIEQLSGYECLSEEIVGSVPEPFSLSVDLNIKYPKCSLAEDSSASVLQVLKRSSSVFTSVYVVVQKLKKTLARASVQLNCNSKLNDVDLLLEAKKKCFSSKKFTRREKDCFMLKRIKHVSLGIDTSKFDIEVQQLSFK